MSPRSIDPFVGQLHHIPANSNSWPMKAGDEGRPESRGFNSISSSILSSAM